MIISFAHKLIVNELNKNTLIEGIIVNNDQENLETTRTRLNNNLENLCKKFF